MKFWLLVFLVMCGQVASTQDRKAAQAFEGCYELRVEGRQPLLNYGNQFLPKRFQLKAERVYGGYGKKPGFKGALGFASFILAVKG